MKLSISKAKTHFERDGKPFFLLGDTCWSAFTHPTTEEWNDYLSYRQEEGFNALQINVLPQRHACRPNEWRHPFALKEDGSYDFDQLQPAYFEHAKKRLALMREKNMIPMLILLWGNYVPGTWQQRLDAGRVSVLERPFSMVMPYEAMRRYVSYAVDCFKEFDPLWVISGDTNLDAPEPVRYYAEALRIAKAQAPHCLTSLHLYPTAEIPDSLLHMPELDYYMFQPGHDATHQELNRVLSRKFSALPVARPAMNSEACYECNSYFDATYGRFDRRHMRRAFWESVLNGACAGFTYGAAGIWLWQRRDMPCSLETPLFPGEGKRWFDQAHDWRSDLDLGGGWDVAFGKWLLETFRAWDLKPQDHLVFPEEPEIAAAASGDGSVLMIYTPCATRLKVRRNLEAYTLQWIDLETRQTMQAITQVEAGETLLSLPRGGNDCLLIARKA